MKLIIPDGVPAVAREHLIDLVHDFEDKADELNRAIELLRETPPSARPFVTAYVSQIRREIADLHARLVALG